MANHPISVWWDIENCQVPTKVNPESIMQNIKNVIYQFPSDMSLAFCAIGDMSRVPERMKAALEQSGIVLEDYVQTGESSRT